MSQWMGRVLRSNAGLVGLAALVLVSATGVGVLGVIVVSTQDEVRQLEADLSRRILRGETAVSTLTSNLDADLEGVEATLRQLEGRVGGVEIQAGEGPDFNDLIRLSQATQASLRDVQSSLDSLTGAVDGVRSCLNQALVTSFRSFELGVRSGNYLYVVSQC